MRRKVASRDNKAFGHALTFVRSVLIVFFFALSAVHSARAEPIRIAVFSLMPFGGQGEDGQLGGIIPEIWDRILRDSGIEANIEVMPYKRMFHSLSRGTIDAAIYFRTPQSQTVSRAITPVYTLRNVVVGKNGNDIVTYDDLQDQKIGVARGTFYQERFDQDATLDKMPIPGFLHGVKLLLSDRLDLVAGPEVSFAWHLGNMGYDPGVLGKSFFLGTRSAWLQVPIKGGRLTEGQINDLASRIEELRKSGVIDRVMQRYRWVGQ